MTDYRIKVPRRYLLDKKEKTIYKLGFAEGRIAQKNNPNLPKEKLIGERQEQEINFHGI